jgi:hypothetical protein
VHASQPLHGFTLSSIARIISDCIPISSAAIKASFKSISQLPFTLPHDRPIILGCFVSAKLVASNLVVASL